MAKDWNKMNTTEIMIINVLWILVILNSVCVGYNVGAKRYDLVCIGVSLVVACLVLMRLQS